jgi:hypothetical protein
MSDYLITTRAIRGGSFSSEPGPTRFLKVPNKKNLDPSHEINRTNFITDVVGTPAAQKFEDIVVFVHGYNVTQSDLIKRHRSIRAGLVKAGYKGQVLSFDWPAKSNAANYLEDRSDARRVALQLVDDCITAFAALVKKGCTINLPFQPPGLPRRSHFHLLRRHNPRRQRPTSAKSPSTLPGNHGQISFLALILSKRPMPNLHKPEKFNRHDFLVPCHAPSRNHFQR